ncbi:helix-turn-helix domain-containing protein [Erythrobacter donghaensis]|jgi:AraC-like DNA-binding protein|uniref:helix-turn-helix domain-containing protein n=1 Tax=Erythrobacter donghaensis TaxID=267135 RepID=UPI00093E081C|nr:helix-turn-helix domain-containing protein [Erythrobacter donghaensis]
MQFGAWSTLLAVLAGQNLVLGVLLWRTPANRMANRYLALLLVCVAGMMTPFIIGYAGAYDRWPWLTSAPLAVPLAIGPLLYGHVTALSRGTPIGRSHLIAPVSQFLYQAALFPFPVATKYWWDEHVHQPYLSPALLVAVIASMTFYAVLGWRELDAYRNWLAARRRLTRPATRLRAGLIFLGVILVARAAWDLFDLLVRPIDYFDLFVFYVLLGMSALVIGVLGWRDSSAPIAVMDLSEERDWHAQGATWLARLESEGWWRDPELDLDRLARLLGTNTTHLSKALNEGHGGFAECLGRLRAGAVAKALEQGSEDDLLGLALECGFGSKASFNRIFRAHLGMSPSSYRANVQGSKVTS